jgi:hypothetical protein
MSKPAFSGFFYVRNRRIKNDNTKPTSVQQIFRHEALYPAQGRINPDLSIKRGSQFLKANRLNLA